MLNLHDIIEIVGASGLVTAAGYIWKAAQKLGGIEAALMATAEDVRDIKTNHLPHVEGEIKELRGAFIEHLQKHGGS